MAVKAIAETSKARTSNASYSKQRTTGPGLQAKSAKATSVNNTSPTKLRNIIRTAKLQPKLVIGSANDRYEQEADSIADKVVSISAGSLKTDQSAQGGHGNAGAPLQTSRKISTQPNGTAWSSAPANMGPSTPSVTSLQDSSSQANMISLQQEEGEEDIQAKFALQRSFMDLEGDLAPTGFSDVLTKPIQASQAAESTTSSSFESRLNSTKGAGSPLPPQTRSQMESGIGADFSGVSVHTGASAVQMNQEINSRAFTHGNDIYFNQGQYNPDSSNGQHLLAHELTHTVQQGASVQTKPDIHRQSTSLTGKKIQRGWLGDAWDSVSSAAGAAVDWAADQLNQALNWAKDQFSEFVQAIPGYSLLSVILGEDPVRGTPVARNGRNFIEAGLDIIPFGGMFKRKLEETGAMEEAATWLDERMAAVDVSLSAIVNSISSFWRGLSITDLADIPAVLSRAAAIIRNPIARIISFATSIASKLLEIVKKAVLTALVNFVKNHTRAYPLLTVILRKDPITDEVVERSGMNLIRGFMLLSEAGEEQLRQMEETGSLQRAADWIDSAVARLDLSWEAIQNMFRRAWDLVSIESLMNPVAAFLELAGIFLEPAGRILRFVVEVALKILQLIKDALISRLVAYARTVRGYPLLTVILGRDPFSGDTVLRNTENLVHGFMSLMEGGEAQFQEMKSTGAIGRLSARVEAAMARLNFTWEYIRGLFVTAWESFSLADLAAPLDAFMRLLGIFGEPLLRLVAFVWEIVKIVIEVLLIMMSFPFNLINNIITRAMEAIEDIKRDPIGFLKNLIRAVKQGFVQFFDNILNHLLNGLVDWLFGELGDAGITPPADLSFGSILTLVFEILGVTMERIWQKLADRIGQERVDRIRSMIDRLTGIWTFVRDVMERGPGAIWEYIQDQLSNLWDTVLEAIRNWIVTRIIQQVTVRLLSMLDPTGIMAVVNGFIAFYNAVQSFIRYLREMLEIVNSFVVGVAEIARGDVSRAANFLEGALAQAVPIAIGFLANQVGLGGIGRRIGEMIQNVRSMVDRALDWLVDRAVSAGSALLNMGSSAVGAVRGAVSRLSNWWSARKQFRSADGHEHSIYFQGSGPSSRLMIASDPTNYTEFINNVSVPADKQGDKTEAIGIADNLDVAIREASVSGSSPSPASGTTAGSSTANDHATNIQGLLDQLGAVTARFMPMGSTMESTPPVYGGRVNGFGSSVSVMRLSSRHEPGSETSTSTYAPWAPLRRRKDGGGSYYVQGHLLNNNLGGPGRNWDNLTPLTQGANNRNSDSHYRGFEQDVKNAVDAGKIVNFIVHANYGAPGRAADAAYFRSQGNPDDDVRASIVEAEEKIPVSLDCRAFEVSPTDGSVGNAIKVHQVNNEIDTNRNHYALSPSPKQTVYLNDMTRPELLSLTGIGDGLADAIISNRPFRTKAEIQASVHIAEGRWAQIQSTPGKSVRIYRS